jgi:hypothetical protein
VLDRLHKALRRWLWAWAVVLAVMVALAWILGSWKTASNIVHSVIFVLVGGYLAWLIIAGWVEWRQKRRNRNAG